MDETSKMRMAGSWRRPVAAAILLAALGLLALRAPVADWLDAVRGPLAAAGWTGVAAYAVVGAVLGTLLVPGSVLNVGAALVFPSFAAALVAAHAACWGAAMGAFAISRSSLRPLVERRLGAGGTVDRLDRGIAAEGWSLLALVRLCPVMPFGPANYCLGMTSVGWRTYLGATALFMLPCTALYVWLAHLGRLGLEGFAAGGEGARLRWALSALGAAVVVLIAVLLTRLLRRALRERGLAED